MHSPSAHNPRTTLALAKIEATQAKASATFFWNFFTSKFVVTPGIARARARCELQRQDLHVYFPRGFHACLVASPEFGPGKVDKNKVQHPTTKYK